MKQSFGFNVHAEIFQNDSGDLAVKLPGDYAFGGLGTRKGESFPEDILRELYGGRHPGHWQELPARQLVDDLGWQCVAMLGFVNGNLNRAAMELEVDPKILNRRVRQYLAPLLMGRSAL